MDRRQQKTRKAIFAAFNKLLVSKHYTDITVQNIIDEANVGRSTFYAHFPTKDDLLDEMCTEIFNHIFSDTLTGENTHDFSASEDSLQVIITHMFYHLQDNSHNIRGILSGESSELFIRYFKNYMINLFVRYSYGINCSVPQDFYLEFLTDAFVSTVRWWMNGHIKISPEQMADYYMTVTHLQ